jgi:hypothetical protein
MAEIGSAAGTPRPAAIPTTTPHLQQPPKALPSSQHSEKENKVDIVILHYVLVRSSRCGADVRGKRNAQPINTHEKGCQQREYTGVGVCVCRRGNERRSKPTGWVMRGRGQDGT